MSTDFIMSLIFMIVRNSRVSRGLVRMMLCLVFGLSVVPDVALAQTVEPLASSQVLKKLSVEELMDLEVTSVSRRPERLSETASAIQVITSEDIRRSGATTLPEVLRLAANLHVAQVNSSEWAISARGFNNTAANKMLVLIDGRSVYTPLHAGVFWDIQDTLLEDIDRIEVISGSGATLWGANAVNGVISIKTKQARETQGLFVESGGGSQPRGFMNVRYGGQFSANSHYRVYGKIFSRDRTLFSNGRDTGNEWKLGQTGLRLDWHRSSSDVLTLQGDFYDGALNHLGTPGTDIKGGNLLARWSHVFSDKSDLSLQLYYDRTHRGLPRSLAEDLSTYDVDFQHRFRLGERNEFVWGLGYRQVRDDINYITVLAFLPAQVTRRRFSGFLQDELALIKDRLSLTLGAKLEHNDYTGLEVQPSVRAAWKIDRRQTAWGAISRAVRTPSRFDRELFIPAQPPFLLAGGPNFQSEESLGYELGYRSHPHDRLSLSVSTFYTDYTNLRSIEQLNPPAFFPMVVGNGLKGKSYGAELTADYYVTNWWQLHGGFTEMRIKIRPDVGSTDRSNGSGESHDPNRHLLLRSSFEPIRQIQFDSTFRYASEIPNQQLPGYAELDLRMSWQPKSSLEFSIVGQNLLHQRHAEFGLPASRQEIARSLYGKVVWRFLKH
jgi:iron complex outermembrane receptor protein